MFQGAAMPQGEKKKHSPKIVVYKIAAQCGSIDKYETCTRMSKNGYKAQRNVET